MPSVRAMHATWRQLPRSPAPAQQLCMVRLPPAARLAHRPVSPAACSARPLSLCRFQGQVSMAVAAGWHANLLQRWACAPCAAWVPPASAALLRWVGMEGLPYCNSCLPAAPQPQCVPLLWRLPALHEALRALVRRRRRGGRAGRRDHMLPRALPPPPVPAGEAAGVLHGGGVLPRAASMLQAGGRCRCWWCILPKPQWCASHSGTAITAPAELPHGLKCARARLLQLHAATQLRGRHRVSQTPWVTKHPCTLPALLYIRAAARCGIDETADLKCTPSKSDRSAANHTARRTCNRTQPLSACPAAGRCLFHPNPLFPAPPVPRAVL